MYKLQNKKKTLDDDDVEDSDIDMGLEVEDIDGDNISLSHVVDKVVSHINEVNNTNDDGDGDDVIDSKYMFPRFFALMIYGPFGSDEDKLDILREGKQYIAYNLS